MCEIEGLSSRWTLPCLSIGTDSRDEATVGITSEPPLNQLDATF